MRLLTGGIGMSDGNHDPLGCDMANPAFGASKFRGQGNDAHGGGGITCHIEPGFHGGGQKVGGNLGAAPVCIQKGSFHMCAQYDGAFAFRALHHRIDALQGCFCILYGGAHGGG
jgi:hypothetical protein